ncbi:hypothetical protein Cadr_000006722 [Camelus dromedarius]|uniref:Uncharacterized protein n=1 Tax=Camelus dromedarius TaxID=9838 RepID=A0A5N4E564_CAMDR|nr:hypothetical protein Cadr_000006722 [Camelus dromedarius]
MPISLALNPSLIGQSKHAAQLFFQWQVSKKVLTILSLLAVTPRFEEEIKLWTIEISGLSDSVIYYNDSFGIVRNTLDE